MREAAERTTPDRMVWCTGPTAEIPLIEQWFATIGDKLPRVLRDELEALEHRLD